MNGTNTWEQLRQLLKEGGKCVILEDGEIKGVLTNWEDYQKMNSKSLPRISSNLLETKEKEIRAFLSKMIEKESDLLEENFDYDKIKVEDLPV